MAFVVSAGQLAVTGKAPGIAAYSTALADGVVHDYATIWKTQPQVRTVVSFLARNIAQLGLHLYRRVSDVDRERVTDHPVAELLGRPTPRTTRYRLVDSLVNDIGIYDQAFLAKLKPDGGRPGLLRIDPRFVSPLGDNPFDVDGWRIKGNKGHRDLSPDDVVHFRGHNPSDSRLGASPIETLRRILAEEFEAGRYREQLWRNSARTSGYLKRPSGAPKWDGAAKARFREQWQAQYTGSGPGAGGTPILEDGMEFEGVASTARDAQYIEARKLTREEVAAAYHIPLPMVGILDNATFSNIKEQHKQLYQDTLGPWLTMLVEDLQLQLLDDFPDTDGLYLEFNIAEKLRGSFEEQAAQLQTSVGGPWMTRNEARARVNLPQIDGGDELIVPLNVIAGGQASPTDSAPPPDGAQTASGRTRQGKTRLLLSKARPDGFEDRTQRLFAGFFERQGRSVISELGREKAAGRKASISDVFDVDRWSGELAADLFGLNLAIATTAGRTSMSELGEDPDEFDEPRTEEWHLAAAAGIALAITLVTGNRLSSALDEDDPLAAVRGLFELFVAARAGQLAVSHVTSMAGFGSTEAARQLGRPASKTWRVRSSNPRRAHARLNGDTVGVDEVFANGARWPGDSGLDEDERANCHCDLEMTVIAPEGGTP